MHIYAVGHPYSQNVTSWPDGSSDYNWFDDGHELRLFLDNPTSRELHDYKKGRAEFSLAVVGPIISIAYRFGAQPWSDSTYNYWLTPADRRPEMLTTWEKEAQRFLLQVVLIDASNGIVKALRAVTLSPEFSAALAIAARHQVEKGDPGAAYDRTIESYLQTYPQSTDLLPLSIARCTGGTE